MSNLSPELQALATRLAERHRIPKAEYAHPAVILPGDEFMTEKLRDPDYVPYCFGSDCGRTRRTAYGFKCPTCGNQMNYDLTHYDGNKNVQYADEAPSPEVVLSGFQPVPGEWWRHARRPPLEVVQERAKYAERKAWNDAVDAKKLAKKGPK